MNNEIKEILDYINDRVIEKEKWNKVKDYITNLQQENERLKNMLNNADNKNLWLIEEINDKQDIIDKAIEYIKNHIIATETEDILLNILQNGIDDNE